MEKLLSSVMMRIGSVMQLLMMSSTAVSSGDCWVLHVEDVDYRSRLGSRLNEVADGGKGIIVVLCVVSQEGIEVESVAWHVGRLYDGWWVVEFVSWCSLLFAFACFAVCSVVCGAGQLCVMSC